MVTKKPKIPKETLERYKINAETGRLPWQALEKFFANGSLVIVASGADLVDVAYEFSQDNAEKTAQWLTDGTVGKVTDDQAIAFQQANNEFWVVVARPWVLIQLLEPDQE